MKPFLADADLTLWQGEVLEVLAELPSESADCVVTSPPYWGLRDYGTGAWEGGDPDCEHRPNGGRNSDVPSGTGGRAHVPGAPHRGGGVDGCDCGARRVDFQIGLEPRPELYVERLVAVFREVRRVLAPHGTVWLNLGDSYVSTSAAMRPIAAGGKSYDTLNDPAHPTKLPNAELASMGREALSAFSLKPKDLVMMPARVALALQADGWFLRSEVVWSKPNPMPESTTDRPTKSHETVYLLTKRGRRYYYDREAVLEPFEAKTAGSWSRSTYEARNQVPAGKKGTYTREYRHPALHAPPQAETLDPSLPPEAPRGADGRRKTTRVEHHDRRQTHENYANAYGGERWPGEGRNMRSVWQIPVQPYQDAHFAVFPEELPRRCIEAGCPREVCRTCGEPRRRIVERTELPQTAEVSEQRKDLHGPTYSRHRSSIPGGQSLVGGTTETLGWTDCGHGDYRPGRVLDPFAGSGTTGLVARKLDRHAVLVELNPDYCELIGKRTQQLSLLGDEAA